MRARWPAAIPSRSGRTAKFRGDLVLTDRRLIFDPGEIPEAMSPLVAPYLRDAIKAAMRPLPLSEIATVRADDRRPALLHLAAQRGPLRYVVLCDRDTPAWRRRNSAVRDEAVAAIDGLVTR